MSPVRLSHNLSISASALVVLAGCASNEPPVAIQDLAPSAIEKAVAASCPDDASYIEPEQIEISSTRLEWSQDRDDVSKTFGALKPVAVYELDSTDSRWGGLSGIDFLDQDTLVIVSDDGKLVWLDIDPETFEPASTAGIAVLRDSEGDPLDGKKDADAEGLAWSGDALFVSFERNHRVLAYDIAVCGSGARGVEVLEFAPNGFGLGKSIEDNRGLEALAIDEASNLFLGLETNDGGSPVGLFGEVGETGFNNRLPSPELTMLTGLDSVEGGEAPDRLYSIFRSYDPLRGNRIALAVTEVGEDGTFSETDQFVIWGSSLLVDNFEGVAAMPLTPDTDRIVIVSDDNFSDRQKTLLAVFDYAHQ